MTDRAVSEETMLGSLLDIRLPPDAAGGVLAELLVAIGAGAGLALLGLLVLRLFTVRRKAHRRKTPADHLAEARNLPDEGRRVALLRLLREVAPDSYSDLRHRLYARDAVSLAELEAEVAAHV